MKASTQKPTSVSRKKPWNRTNPPIYSIASRHEERYNMNICSYVTPISMKPSRIVVGVYKNTLTLELVTLQNEMVLQLLSEDQYSLIKLLGQTTGYKKDKIWLVLNHKKGKKIKYLCIEPGKKKIKNI